MSKPNNAPLQLDLLSLSGIPTTPGARSVLKEIDELARFHDQQGRHDAVISLSPKQAKKLAEILKINDQPRRWRGHPLRIFTDVSGKR